MKLIIHPASAEILDKMTVSLPHAVLLSGQAGLGVSTIATNIAMQQTKTPSVVLPEKDDKIDLEKGTITVDSIRRLYTETRSKQAAKRVIVIDYADRMTHQAQNAFLKLLEEPNETTHFILASHQPDRLLATVLSRVQHFQLPPATTEQSNALLDDLTVTDPTKRTQLLLMADGLPAELHRLCADDAYFDRRATMMRDARQLLQGSPYGKLLIAHNYRDDRPKSLRLIEDAIRIARRTLSKNMQPELVMYLDRLLYAYDRILANGNIRLSIATLVI